MTIAAPIYSDKERGTFRRYAVILLKLFVVLVIFLVLRVMSLDLALWSTGLGLIPAVIAYRKERYFISWWIFGILLFIVALPVAICMKSPGKVCPSCVETVKVIAKVCRYCQHSFMTDAPPHAEFIPDS
jgi:hypothetical protein